jgi:hypothetical protein
MEWDYALYLPLIWVEQLRGRNLLRCQGRRFFYNTA